MNESDVSPSSPMTDTRAYAEAAISDSIPTESGVTSSGASVATALMPALRQVGADGLRTGARRCGSPAAPRPLPFVVNDTTISGSSSVLPAFM